MTKFDEQLEAAIPVIDEAFKLPARGVNQAIDLLRQVESDLKLKNDDVTEVPSDPTEVLLWMGRTQLVVNVTAAISLLEPVEDYVNEER